MVALPQLRFLEEPVAALRYLSGRNIQGPLHLLPLLRWEESQSQVPHVQSAKDGVQPVAPAPLPEADARELFDLVSGAGVIPGVRWRYSTPLRWYIEADFASDVHTVAPHALPGGDVAAGQPRGTDARRWQAWLNELHMLLFDAAPNLAREARDLPPANGLWLWGGGTVPALASAPFVAVWSDEPVIGGLARLAWLAPLPLPPSPDWLRELPVGRSLLGLGADAAEPDQLAVWLVALQAALDDGRIQSVTLLAGGGSFLMRRRGLFARLRRGLFSR